MLEIRINKAHFPVTTLGPGRRLALWFQGCSIRCPGCISRDTWEFEGEKTSIEALLDGLAPWLEEADGLTLSGGEPCDQYAALLGLLKGVRAREFGGDILLFSGYDFPVIERRFPDVLAIIDALVSGPYREEFPTEAPLRGSENQVLHVLTSLGERVFAAPGNERALDLLWEGATAWLAGIPRAGDWQRLREKLDAAGVAASFSDDAEIPWRC